MTTITPGVRTSSAKRPLMRFALLFLLTTGTASAQVPGWQGLRDLFGGRGSDEISVTATVGPYEILGQGKVVAHNHFERELDAPDFYNFTSTEQNVLTGMKRVNSGTCYGISMFTIRYYQWFILPHVLDDDALASYRGTYSRSARREASRPLPPYARQVAADLKLPAWILQWPEGDENARRQRVMPYRLRNLLKNSATLRANVQRALASEENKDLEVRFSADFAKEHATRMFDNQMYLMRKGAQLYELVNRASHRYGDSENPIFEKLFGKCSFNVMKELINDVRYGCCEVAMWGSTTFKNMWGHSVVGYRITEFDARKTGETKTSKAFRVDIYDNNDPDDTSDDAFYYFAEEQRFTPSTKYADFYDDGTNPLVPSGEQFLRTTQMGPGTEAVLLRFEQNMLNRFSKKFERVEVE